MLRMSATLLNEYGTVSIYCDRTQQLIRFAAVLAVCFGWNKSV